MSKATESIFSGYASEEVLRGEFIDRRLAMDVDGGKLKGFEFWAATVATGVVLKEASCTAATPETTASAIVTTEVCTG